MRAFLAGHVGFAKPVYRPHEVVTSGRDRHCRFARSASDPSERLGRIPEFIGADCQQFRSCNIECGMRLTRRCIPFDGCRAFFPEELQAQTGFCGTIMQWLRTLCCNQNTEAHAVR